MDFRILDIRTVRDVLHTGELRISAPPVGTRGMVLGEVIVKIATKLGFDLTAKGGSNSRRSYQVDGCLERLCTDRIDLLYQHRVDPNVPIEEVAGAVKELIEDDRVFRHKLSGRPLWRPLLIR